MPGSARVAAYLGLLRGVLLARLLRSTPLRISSSTQRFDLDPGVGAGGGLLIAVAILIENGFVLAASVLDDYGGDTRVTKMFVVWQWLSATLLAPGFLALLTGGTLGALSSRSAPRWFRWASVVLLVLVVLIAGVLEAPGLATAPGSLWVVLVSILLIARPSAFGTGAATTPSEPFSRINRWS